MAVEKFIYRNPAHIRNKFIRFESWMGLGVRRSARLAADGFEKKAFAMMLAVQAAHQQ